MATLQYDPEQGNPEFSEDELDSLAVGERMVEEQQQLLAGKFEDAQALEKAYLELQSKMGSRDAEPVEEEAPEEQPEEVEVNPATTLISEASTYWAEHGELTEEMLSQFSEMSSTDLLNAYINAQGSIPQVETPDLTETEVASIKNQVGGDQQYEQLMGWASESLDESVVEAYDSLVDSGNSAAIALALRGIRAEYESAVGYEGRMLTGRSSTETADVFRSQAEVVQAMSDPRYDRDPAYRDDVFRKLDRSNVSF